MTCTLTAVVAKSATDPGPRPGQPSIRDAFGPARRRLAAAPAMCSNAARTRSLDVKRSSVRRFPSRTVHTHPAFLQVRAWPLDAESSGDAR